jgi:hypothetical protein
MKNSLKISITIFLFIAAFLWPLGLKQSVFASTPVISSCSVSYDGEDLVYILAQHTYTITVNSTDAVNLTFNPNPYFSGGISNVNVSNSGNTYTIKANATFSASDVGLDNNSGPKPVTPVIQATSSTGETNSLNCNSFLVYGRPDLITESATTNGDLIVGSSVTFSGKVTNNYQGASRPTHTRFCAYTPSQYQAVTSPYAGSPQGIIVNCLSSTQYRVGNDIATPALDPTKSANITSDPWIVAGSIGQASMGVMCADVSDEEPGENGGQQNNCSYQYLTIKSNQVPSCSFIANKPAPITANINEQLIFTSTSTDPDGTIASRVWTSNGGSPLTGYADNFSWSSPSAGNYTIALSVTDNNNDTSSCSANITVNTLSTPAPTDTSSLPPTVTAAAPACINGSITGNEVTFNWTNNTNPPYRVQIAETSNFNDSALNRGYQYLAKDTQSDNNPVKPWVSSVTGPSGFYTFPSLSNNDPTTHGPLFFKPETTYYVRMFSQPNIAKTGSFGPTTSFNIPTCYDFHLVKHGDIHVTPGGPTVTNTISVIKDSGSNREVKLSFDSTNSTIPSNFPKNLVPISVYPNPNEDSSLQISAPVGAATSKNYSVVVKGIAKSDSGADIIKEVTVVVYVDPPTTSTGSSWIQTSGGDVHSNEQINTPGGPN